MDRRKFLRNAGVALGAGVAFPSVTGFGSSSVASSLDSWPEVRSQFPLEKGKIHMAQMLLASHPRPVQEAINRHRERFDANPTEYWENNFQTAEPRVLKSASEYLEAEPGEIALTDSTTQGLGTLYCGFRLKSGDEILTTTHDHYSTEKALEFAAMKSGASINRISLYDNPADVSVDEIVGRLKKAIRPNTRLVAVTWVHSSTGVKLPLREMSEVIRVMNSRRDSSDRIYFAVDGVHGFGIENVNMRELGCDYFVAGTHKWLFGPRGTGFIWARKDAWDMVIPTIPAFSYSAYGAWLGLMPEENMNFSDRSSPGGFHAFDHRWALGEAFDFHMRIGKDKVELRTHQLSSMLKEGLSELSHIKLHTPLSSRLSAGINCFEVDGMTPVEVVSRLHEKHIIGSTSPYRISYARLTPCIINTEDEVRMCIKALEQIKP